MGCSRFPPLPFFPFPNFFSFSLPGAILRWADSTEAISMRSLNGLPTGMTTSLTHFFLLTDPPPPSPTLTTGSPRPDGRAGFQVPFPHRRLFFSLLPLHLNRFFFFSPFSSFCVKGTWESRPDNKDGARKPVSSFFFLAWSLPLSQKKKSSRKMDIVSMCSSGGRSRLRGFSPFFPFSFPPFLCAWRCEKLSISVLQPSETTAPFQESSFFFFFPFPVFVLFPPPGLRKLMRGSGEKAAWVIQSGGRCCVLPFPFPPSPPPPFFF